MSKCNISVKHHPTDMGTIREIEQVDHPNTVHTKGVLHCVNIDFESSRQAVASSRGLVASAVD